MGEKTIQQTNKYEVKTTTHPPSSLQSPHCHCAFVVVAAADVALRSSAFEKLQVQLFGEPAKCSAAVQCPNPMNDRVRE